MAASSTSFATISIFQSLKRFFKVPWEITGPCSDFEYWIALPKAIEYRRFCPTTTLAKVCVPTLEPKNVFAIAYYPHDHCHDRPPIHHTMLKKVDGEKMMAEKTFGVGDFPWVYLIERVQEDENTRGGRYQK